MSVLSPYDVAAGMFRRTTRTFIPVCVLLATLETLPHLISLPGPLGYFTLVAVRRVVELVGLALLFKSWLREFGKPLEGGIPGRLLVAGGLVAVLLGFCSVAPLAGVLAPEGLQGPTMLFAVIAAAFTVWFLYLHFMYAPVILGGAKTLRSILEGAREYTRLDRWLPVKVIIPGFAAVTILQSIALMPAPDGGTPLWNSLAALVTPLAWLLQSQLVLAFFFIHASPTVRERLQLTEPVEQKLTAAALQAPAGIAPLLEPARAGWGAFVAVLLWGANYLAALSFPPTAQTSQLQSTTNGNDVVLHLIVTDTERKLRAFNPTGLHLRSPEGIQFHHQLKGCTFQEGHEKPQPCPLLPLTDAPLQLELSLSYASLPARPWILWYRNVKLLEVPESTVPQTEMKP